MLHEARLRCDPDQATAVEQNALEHRGVWLDHRESTATTLLTARLDTLDALDLDGSITDLVAVLKTSASVLSLRIETRAPSRAAFVSTCQVW